jgi:N-acetylglucosaminyl-diphospho-decaprenol L-rhamnosyltransferase
MDGISGRVNRFVYACCGIHKNPLMTLLGAKMDVSIIIVNWNTRVLLGRCLRSIEAGVDGLAAQVLVVDNGSADGSAELVEHEFTKVELLRNPENVGFARANNQACGRVKGRYVLLLNPDTELRSGAVNRMVMFLDANPRRAGVTAVLRNPDGTLQRYHKRLPRWMRVVWSETLLRNVFPNNRWVRELYMLDESFDAVIEIEQPPAACLMLRKSVIVTAELFDEQFPIFYNDVDLCRRLRDAGHRLFLLPEAEVMHYGGAGGVGAMPDQGVADSLIGLIRYYRKHEGFISAVVLWMILTINSSLVLLGGLLKVLGGRRTLQWWRLELAKRVRLAAGHETFHYPKDRSVDLISGAATCRR